MQSIAKSLLITPFPVLAQFVQVFGANISPSLGKNKSNSGVESGLFALCYCPPGGGVRCSFVPWVCVY